MNERTQGIILRTRPLTETSLIAHWLTADLGRLATVARGARRPRSPFRGKLDLFYEADFNFARSRRSDLHTLCEVSLQETHPALRQDLGRLRQAAYAAAFVEKFTETETPLPAIYALFKSMLDQLGAAPVQPSTVLSFELRLLRELGQAPDLAAASLSPGARQVARHFSESDWPGLQTLRASPEQLREVQQFLHGFLIYHLGSLPRGRAAALSLTTVRN